jgi:Tfp pilus assembly protein PilN
MVRQEPGITAPSGQVNPERAAVILGILGDRVLWSEVFVQFSRIVPKGLWFDNLEGSATGTAEVRIKGGALSYLAIAEFMLSMEKSNYFEKPQLVYAQKAVVQGQEIVGYEIIAAIKRTQGAQ